MLHHFLLSIWKPRAQLVSLSKGYKVVTIFRTQHLDRIYSKQQQWLPAVDAAPQERADARRNTTWVAGHNFWKLKEGQSSDCVKLIMISSAWWTLPCCPCRWIPLHTFQALITDYKLLIFICFLRRKLWTFLQLFEWKYIFVWFYIRFLKRLFWNNFNSRMILEVFMQFCSLYFFSFHVDGFLR